MTVRLIGDENTSHHLVSACRKIAPRFPLIHLSDWQDGAHLSAKDPGLLMTLREHAMVLVGFDRASIPHCASALTREGLGHAGVILFRRAIPQAAYGKQARLLLSFWESTRNFNWSDRIEYL
jgi:hypothetical protein